MAETGKNSLSREERIYNDAESLVDAAECVIRFEQKVKTLKSAAAKFEKLGDYRDAAERAGSCREAAHKAKAEGFKTVFLQAKKRQETASEKSDYIDAIANYRRVTESKRYGEQAKEQIAVCKKQIARLETRRVWKKRIITLLVLGLACFFFTLTPAYPFWKGFVREHQGRYSEAVLHYEHADGFPLSDKKLRECHLALGERYYRKGKDKEALQELRQAGADRKVLRLTAKAERRSLRRGTVGERYQFGKCLLLLREKGDKTVLLLYDIDEDFVRAENQVKEAMGFSYGDYFWKHVFQNMMFSAYEQKLILEQKDFGKFLVCIEKSS